MPSKRQNLWKMQHLICQEKTKQNVKDAILNLQRKKERRKTEFVKDATPILSGTQNRPKTVRRCSVYWNRHSVDPRLVKLLIPRLMFLFFSIFLSLIYHLLDTAFHELTFCFVLRVLLLFYRTIKILLCTHVRPFQMHSSRAFYCSHHISFKRFIFTYLFYGLQ